MNTNSIFAAAKAEKPVNLNAANPNAVKGKRKRVGGFMSYAQIIWDIAEKAVQDGTGVEGFQKDMIGAKQHGIVKTDLQARLELHFAALRLGDAQRFATDIEVLEFHINQSARCIASWNNGIKGAEAGNELCISNLPKWQEYLTTDSAELKRLATTLCIGMSDADIDAYCQTAVENAEEAFVRM